MRFAYTLLTATLIFAPTVLGHAAVATSADTASTIVRSDVTRGSTKKCPRFKGPAGTPAEITNGAVTLTGVNFNPGKDGGLQFKASLSTTGPKGTFTPVTVTTNGPADPPQVTSASLVVQIPAGTDCSTGNCQLALDSNGGFGNCVAISGTSGAAAAGTSGAATTTTANETSTTADATSSTAAGTDVASESSSVAESTATSTNGGEASGSSTVSEGAATASTAAEGAATSTGGGEAAAASTAAAGAGEAAAAAATSTTAASTRKTTTGVAGKKKKGKKGKGKKAAAAAATTKKGRQHARDFTGNDVELME